TIGVESTLGQGSTFWVVLPLPLQAEATVAIPTNSSLADLRVCIAISHPVTCRLVTRYLSHWGIIPRMAATESEFLELVMTELATDEHRVVALVDETFADTTDTQLLEALASDTALQEVRIVRLVSFIRRADVAQLPDSAHMHLVTKPVRYESFRDAILTLFDMKPVAPQQIHPAQATQSLSGHVLLAEDNPVNQEIALVMLETLGCSVTVAQNGREAVDQAQTTTYDLILMDCQMPELDGFEATRLIREWEQSNSRSSTPIVALTAHATPGDREQCLAAGMNEYISKPFSMDDLRAVLTSWLQPAPTQSTVEQPAPQPTVTLVPVTPEPESEACLIVDVKAWKSITSLQKPGKEDILAKILTLYLAHSQQLVDTLHQGMNAGDATAVNQSAHSLKSRSAVLGALSLATLCQQFETLSRQGQLKEAEPLQDQLDAAFDHASQFFQAELNKRRAA
ncbi:MAG: response regulator, partial [Nitrospira sp.]|nr:response regulator [Nitrospira sp.]